MLDWIELLAIILLNGLVDVLLVAWVAGKRSKQALVAYLESSESDTMFENVFARFWKRLTSPTMKTGKKILVGEGEDQKEVEQLISPLDNIAQELSRWVLLKIRASVGGKKSQLGDAVAADLADPNSPLASSLGGLFPRALGMGRKGDSGSLIDMLDSLGLLPIVQDYIRKKLQSSIGGGGQQGSW